MKLTTILVPEGLLKALDRIVEEGSYPSRSELIRHAIRLQIDMYREISKRRRMLRVE